MAALYAEVADAHRRALGIAGEREAQYDAPMQ
jgi:hypothetical protein